MLDMDLTGNIIERQIGIISLSYQHVSKLLACSSDKKYTVCIYTVIYMFTVIAVISVIEH